MRPIHLTSDVHPRIRVRPIGAEDRDALAALYARLSAESRYRRFLSPKRELTSRELQYLIDIDQIDHAAFAAINERDGAIVAESRYARDPSRPEAAHIAVVVDDELQRLGIGTWLARLAIECARTNGVSVLIATTFWENHPARSLLRRLGFRACDSDGGVAEYALRLT